MGRRKPRKVTKLLEQKKRKLILELRKRGKKHVPKRVREKGVVALAKSRVLAEKARKRKAKSKAYAKRQVKKFMREVLVGA